MTVTEYEKPHVDRGDGASAEDLQKWIGRRTAGLDHRKKFEDNWRLVQHFLDGQQWTALSRDGRRVVDLRTRDEEDGREHFVIDYLSGYVRAAVGRALSADFRPPIAFRREDWTARGVARQTQRALDFAWDEEVCGDEAIFELMLGLVSYGTEGLWCRFDPTRGPMRGSVPMKDGKPLFDMTEAHDHVAHMQAMGQQAQFKDVHEGKLVWENLGWANIVPPPGVRREKNFPWLVVDRPVPIEQIKMQYGAAAKEIGEEPLGTTSGDPDDRTLKGHAIVSTGFEWPTREHPMGRELVFCQGKKLESRDQLPYKVNGEPKAGVFMFHWQRLKHRFWSDGVAVKLIGPQRNLNRRRGQVSESIDRMGLPHVYAEQGVVTKKNIVPRGKIGYVVEVPQGRQYPQEMSGTGPGPWLQADAEVTKNDMERVAGMGDQSFGQAPQGVTAYSAMSLLKEEMDRNLGPTIMLTRQRLAEVVEVTVEGMRMYWPPDKQIILAGEENIVDAFTFNAAEIPDCYYIQKPKGAPSPNSPAANSQKSFDIYDRSIQGGHPLPLDWLVQSLEEGKPIPLPKGEQDAQKGKAEMENHLLIRGVPVQPAEYDNDQFHIQVHRGAQSTYQLLPGSEEVVANIDNHIKAHVQAAQAKQANALAQSPYMQGPQGIQSQAPPTNPLAPPEGVQLPTAGPPNVGA